MFQQRNGPSLLKHFIRRQVGRGFGEIAAFGELLIQRQDDLSTATFGGAALFPFVGEKVLERRQQEASLLISVHG